MKKVTIYTDGACRCNPGPGGWAAILSCDEIEKEIFGNESNTTNNRMELMAAISALECLHTPSDVDIYTDSQYVKKGITEWIDGWIKNNWKNSKKEPVKNKELWLRLLSAVENHSIKWRWVKGHSGHIMNERVDELARKASHEIEGNI